MSCNTEEIFLLNSYYCTGPDRNNTNIGIPSTTDTDGVSLYNSVMEVVEKCGLEEKNLGLLVMVE